MEWIDIYGDKRRFELKEGNQVFAILQFVNGAYIGRDCLTKLDFTFSYTVHKYNLKYVDSAEILERANRRLLENWTTKAESISKAIAGMNMGREVMLTDYALGQVVHIVELDQGENKYIIIQAKFKGICIEDGVILNMFESFGDCDVDVFMAQKDSDKIFVKHDAAVRECVSLNESLRKGK